MTYTAIQRWIARIQFLLDGADEFTWMLASGRLARYADNRVKGGRWIWR